MNEVLTDDEQVERLKQWWRENGKAIVGGAVLGLLLVFGWQGWQRYVEGHAARASVHYEAFRATAAGGDIESAVQQGDELIGEFGDTLYAALAQLELARLAYDAGDPDTAVTRLQGLQDDSRPESIRLLARLRLARIRLDQGQLDAAASLVGADGGAFAAEFKVLEGDIARAREDKAAAARAYEAALELGADDQDLIRMKLADLGITPAT